MGEFPVRKFEDALLHALWKSRGRRGWWLLEVPVGQGTPTRARRIDAVVIHDARPRVSGQEQDLEEFEEAIVGAHIEVIEAKKRLNFNVVGQVLAGTAMLSEHHPDHGPMDATAVVQTDNDAALRWFCHRERIRIIEIEAAWGEMVPLVPIGDSIWDRLIAIGGQPDRVLPTPFFRVVIDPTTPGLWATEVCRCQPDTARGSDLEGWQTDRLLNPVLRK